MSQLHGWAQVPVTFESHECLQQHRECNADYTGYWEPHDATIDWCERNYEKTVYIAEAFNSLSSLLMCVVSIYWAIVWYRRTRRFNRYLWLALAVGVVGIGSTIFHGSLRYHMQLLDELPMMIAQSCFLYIIYVALAVHRTIPHLAYRSQDDNENVIAVGSPDKQQSADWLDVHNSASLMKVVTFVVVYNAAWAWFHAVGGYVVAFQVHFGVLVTIGVVCMGWHAYGGASWFVLYKNEATVALIHSNSVPMHEVDASDPPKTHTRTALTATRILRKLFVLYVITLLIAMSCWISDQQFCSSVQHFNYQARMHRRAFWGQGVSDDSAEVDIPKTRSPAVDGDLSVCLTVPACQPVVHSQAVRDHWWLQDVWHECMDTAGYWVCAASHALWDWFAWMCGVCYVEVQLHAMWHILCAYSIHISLVFCDTLRGLHAYSCPHWHHRKRKTGRARRNSATERGTVSCAHCSPDDEVTEAQNAGHIVIDIMERHEGLPRRTPVSIPRRQIRVDWKWLFLPSLRYQQIDVKRVD